MSLVGNLEDLGLGDILQIVGLSRKSGALSLRTRGREGRIIFLHGQVIQAASSTFRETVGDLLLRKGVVDLNTLKKALHLQHQMARPERLGAILSGRFNIPRDVIDGIVREQIEKVVYSFFGWVEGTFSFDVGEPDEVAVTRLDPLQFMLEQGLNPQWLATEGRLTAVENTLPGRESQPSLPQASVAPQEKEQLFPSRAKELSPGEIFPKPFHLGVELFEEIGEPPLGLSSASSPGLPLLKGMLEELHEPALGGGIILLVLRFAAEFVNRAVVFSVKGNEITGLGQFGIELPGIQADARVRAMRIPVEEKSPFSAVMDQKIPMKVRPGKGRWDAYLQEMLGRGAPEEIFLAPIVSEGKTVAVLYGDNLPLKAPVGDTETLEIFLSQAGMAMEKALLEQRLQGINAIHAGER